MPLYIVYSVAVSHIQKYVCGILPPSIKVLSFRQRRFVREIFKKTWIIGSDKYITKSKCGGMFGNHRARAAKNKETADKVKRHNLQKSIFNLFLLICANFAKGDWHITLTYQRGLRPDISTSKKLVAKFFRKLKRWASGCNRTLRYIWVTHISPRGAIHHHVILPKWIPYDVLCDAWSAGFVKPGRPLYGNNDYMPLAKYLLTGTEGKAEHSEYGFEDIDDCYHQKCGRRYTPSKNLVRPEPQVEWIEAASWRRNPKPPKGYTLAELYNGEDIWGFPYQIYRLNQVERRE